MARDLSLVALAGQDIVIIKPDRLRSDALEKEARNYLPAHGYPRPRATMEASGAPTPKSFEVWKVLLAAWLQNEGPLTAQEIGRRADASSPTLRSTFARLRLRGEIADTRNRPIELKAFPRATLREILALSGSLRRPFYFADGSGRAADPAGLLRRLADEQPSGVAVGGVVAARVYDPDFDLNGIPRLDLVVDSTDQVGWLHRLNPGLRLVDSSTPSPALVLHPVPNLRIGATTLGKGKLPVADPVETLLDLYELRLTEQAEHFVTRVRERAAAKCARTSIRRCSSSCSHGSAKDLGRVLALAWLTPLDELRDWPTLWQRGLQTRFPRNIMSSRARSLLACAASPRTTTPSTRPGTRSTRAFLVGTGWVPSTFAPSPISSRAS